MSRARGPKKVHQITNPRYLSYYHGYVEWLTTLGYSESVVYNMPSYLREFFTYLEARSIEYIGEAPEGIVRDFAAYLRVRKKLNSSGTLSNTSINSRLYAVDKLSDYLIKEHGIFLPVTVGKLPENNKPKTILTIAEVERLYKFLDSDYLGIRDRAMLGLFYGCGLRSKEGRSLNVKDVQLHRNLIYIRKAKNYHQRLVPMTDQIRNDLENYLLYSRPYLSRKQPNQRSFLVSYRSHRPCASGLSHRLRDLTKRSGISEYKPRVTLHSLRHSIATHLLQKGMKLDDIRQFLGHLSLNSTQVYTHILHELEA